MGILISSCRTCNTPTGKIVLPGGIIHELDGPVYVAELMFDHPRHFVVELPPPSAGITKLVPLPADNKLDPEKVYMMLPMACGKYVMPSVGECRRILTTRHPRGRSQSVQHMCMDVVAVKEDVEGEKMRDEVMRREKAGMMELSPEVVEEGPEFLSRQFSSWKRWKPSLGTIVERSSERKKPHWLLL